MATKRLARQLGLIRRKSSTLANENLGRSKSKQFYDYIIVIDFESTCWNDRKHHNSQEIIEFPAVLLNTSTGEIESEFHAYVQPQEHPILSEFCMELTGIKQAQVDEGVPLKICLSQFCKWIRNIQQEKKCVFTTEASKPSTSEVKLCAFVTWSDWDLGICLEYECKRKQLLKPLFLNSWIDLRAIYKLFYRRKPKGLSGALHEVGLEFSGREHSGLDDSRNTALLAWKMIRDGCLMKITKSLNKAPNENPNTLARNLNTNQVGETSTCDFKIQSPRIYDRASKTSVSAQEKIQLDSVCITSLMRRQQHQSLPENNIKPNLHIVKSSSSVFNTKSSTFQSHSLNSPIYVQNQRKKEHLGFNAKSKSLAYNSELVLVSTTIPSVNHVSNREISSMDDCLPLLSDWEDMALLTASQPEQSIDYKPPISDTDLDTSFNSGERLVLKESNIPTSEKLEDIKETPKKSEISKPFVYKSSHTTVYNVKEAKHPGSDASTFKLPKCKSHTFNSVNANASHYSALGKHPLLGGTKRNSSNFPAFPSAAKQTCIIHEEKPTSPDCSPVRSSSLKALPSVLTTMVNQQELWKNGKMTPPLCKCGRRSKRRIVFNNGPNHGKVFYCCPIGKYNKNRKPCDYFKWEKTLQKERINSIVLSHSTSELPFSSPKPNCIHDKKFSFSTKYSLRLRPSMRN